MNPTKSSLKKLISFTDLPNIGKAMALDFELMGYKSPQELIGISAWALYEKLCKKTGQYQDPCVLDVFLSIEDFLKGGKPKNWWSYTEERKKNYSEKLTIIKRAI